MIDGCRRHNNEVNVVDSDRAQYLARRSGHTDEVFVFFFAVVGSPVEQTVGARNRQEHGDVVVARPAQKTTRFGFVGGRQIGGYRGGTEALSKFDEVRCYACVKFFPLFSGADASAFA